MSEYIGTPGARIEITGKITGVHHYTTCYGYRSTEMTIYTIEDPEGNVMVWKTSGVMGMDATNDRGDWTFDSCHLHDSFTGKATVKAHSEYRGVKQTELSRVKVSSINHAPTKEELDQAKAKEQLASLQDGDFVWNMPYRQYKAHYSDCETVAGTFRYRGDEARIDVIIRAGRLVPNGTRGKHYRGYQFENSNHITSTYYAISEETARKRLLKDFPETTNEDWELTKIFMYNLWRDF